MLTALALCAACVLAVALGYWCYRDAMNSIDR
jgi:ABC-type proline/glycine betaine transport system permease subunit